MGKPKDSSQSKIGISRGVRAYPCVLCKKYFTFLEYRYHECPVMKQWDKELQKEFNEYLRRLKQNESRKD